MPGVGVTALPNHLDLLVIAHRVRRAALNDDPDRLHAELTRLHGDLLHHVHDERERADAAPVMTANVVREGEWRLLRLLSDILFSGPVLVNGNASASSVPPRLNCCSAAKPSSKRALALTSMGRITSDSASDPGVCNADQRGAGRSRP